MVNFIFGKNKGLYFFLFFFLLILSPVVKAEFVYQEPTEENYGHFIGFLNGRHGGDLSVGEEGSLELVLGSYKLNLPQYRYLKINIATVKIKEMVDSSTEKEVFPIEFVGGFKPSADIALSAQLAKKESAYKDLNFKEYLRPINDIVLVDKLVIDENKTIHTYVLEFEILKPFDPDNFDLVFLKIKNIRGVNPYPKIPVFLTLQDARSPEEVKKKVSYVNYLTVYPENLHGVRLKVLDKEKYRLLWDPIKLSTDGFEYYEVRVSSYNINNPSDYGFIHSPPVLEKNTTTNYVDFTLPENENFMVQIRVKQNGVIDRKEKLETFYQLYTPDIIGAVVPLSPFVSYRQDYIQPSPFFPPLTTTPPPNYQENIDRMNKEIEKLKENQKVVTENVNTLQEKAQEIIRKNKQTEHKINKFESELNKQGEKVSFLQRIITKIESFLKSLFGSF